MLIILNKKFPYNFDTAITGNDWHKLASMYVDLGDVPRKIGDLLDFEIWITKFIEIY